MSSKDEKSILKIFIIIGSSIGFIGTAVGLFIGMLFSINIDKIQKLLEDMTGSNLFSAEIYFLSKLPSKIIISEVIIVVFIQGSSIYLINVGSGKLEGFCRSITSPLFK